MKDSLLASEKFLFDYPPFNKSSVRAGIGFPNHYSVGMASLGYQLVWHMFRSCPDLSVYRFFLPEDGREPRILENGMPLTAMDVLAFSVSFEMDYLNLLNMLSASGIPLLSRDRTEECPIVLIGGPVTLINPAPLYSFADALYTGDLEPCADALCGVLARKQALGRAGTLERLAELEGVTVPALGKTGVRQIEHDLDRYCAHSVITTPNAGFGDTVLFEIARGCRRGCKFCAAGNTTRPMRLRKPVLPEYHSYGIVGAAVFDSPDAVDIARDIVRRKATFSLSSLRLETLDREKLLLMKQGGARTVTIAPEAGTEAMRRFIGKACPDETILRAAELVDQAGFGRLKLYFMTGLPGETDADTEGITGLIRSLRRLHPRMSVQASVGIFVPKPSTPFADEQQPAVKELERRISLVRSRYIKGAEITCESPRLARVQWILARSDRDEGREFLLKCMEGGYRAGLRLFD
ncbi:MAG: radical SAM protein [Abditibacteriota bacterium]|nr:radical SAM protein [Abditibacteriota bacterium]